MLQQIHNFLHSIFHRLLPVRRPYPGPATQQAIPEQYMDNLRSDSTMKRGLPETDKIPVMLLPIQNPDSGPYPATIRPQQPTNRYRDLDILLTEIKRDRLDKTQTSLIARPVQRMARQLQRNLEQED